MATDLLESSHPLQPGERYRSAAIALHWVIFGLVVVVGVLGLLHDSWPKQTQASWINVHALIGILLWMLLIARLATVFATRLHRCRRILGRFPATVPACYTSRCMF
jgi:cytochrome b561